MPRYYKALYIALRKLCKFLSIYEGKKSVVQQKHFLPQFRLTNRSVSCEVRKVERAGPKLLKVLGFSSYIDSYCFMVIASSPFPCTAPWICICLGGVQKIQRPHTLGCCPWGEPLEALHPSQGTSSRCLIVSNLTNLYETGNSCERQLLVEY